MLIIGITGSIGMGKTTVSKMLEILKIPVFDSDKKVKEILEKNSKVIKKILRTWPDTVLKNQKQEKRMVRKLQTYPHILRTSLGSWERCRFKRSSDQKTHAKR